MLSTDQEIIDVHCQSIVTQKGGGGGYICANPNDFCSSYGDLRCAKKKKRREHNHGSVVLTCSPYVQKLKKYAIRKNELELKSVEDKCVEGHSYTQKTLFKTNLSTTEKTTLVCTVTGCSPLQSLENLGFGVMNASCLAH